MESTSSALDPDEMQGVMPDSASSSSLSSLSSSDDNCEHHHEVTLGFAERAKFRDEFKPSKFPSKVGGCPVWLYGDRRVPIPLRCRRCDSVLAFLLQIYAPIDELEYTFHRMLYVFVCRGPGCAGGPGSVRVLCAQLPRKNPLYPYDPEVGTDDSPECPMHPDVLGNVSTSENKESESTCALCGFNAHARCGRCNKVMYCSRDCQKVDWKLGHNDFCHAMREVPRQALPDQSSMQAKREAWRFEEFVIDHAENPSLPESEAEAPRDHEIRKSTNEMKSPLRGTLQDVDPRELPESLFKNLHRRGNAKVDNAFQRFSDAMRNAPSQILRYWRNGRPLWASSSGHIFEDDSLLLCERCGAKRVFEFQIVPQVLYYIGVDKRSDLRCDNGGCGGLNWATVVIFCCINSCGAKHEESEVNPYSYTEEVAVVQQHS